MYTFRRTSILIHLDLTCRTVSSLVILQDTRVGSSTTQPPRKSSSVNVLNLMRDTSLVSRHPHPHLHLLSSFPLMRNLRIWGSIGAQPQQNPHVPQHAGAQEQLPAQIPDPPGQLPFPVVQQSNINLVYLVLPLLQLLLGTLVEMPDHQGSGGESRNQMLHLHHLQQLLKDRMKKMVMMKKMMILNNKPSIHPLQILSISL
jgi:hypothetical protein